MAAINTNMISLNAQRNLGVTQSALALSIQRLSSGLRVNSAKDDAAGLAIAERMNSQVRGMNVAIRNANDGISLAQTAEGALGKVGDMLQRMRELAVQSANATNSKSDREALNEEVQSLKSEISRMAATTSFNGVKILDGSFTNMTFQVGATSSVNDRINVQEVADIKTTSLGLGTGNSSSVTSSAITGFADLGALAAADLTIAVDGGAAVNIGPIGVATTATQRAEQIMTAINAKSEETGVTAAIDNGTLILSSDTKFVVAGAKADQFFAAASNASTDVGTDGVNSIDVSDALKARTAIDTIDKALAEVSSARANMGALQSRFESVIGNLQISSENIAAARGRIMDTDFAAETANLSRAQVLQQAGMAMLSQANAVPQNVLSLLR